MSRRRPEIGDLVIVKGWSGWREVNNHLDDGTGIYSTTPSSGIQSSYESVLAIARPVWKASRIKRADLIAWLMRQDRWALRPSIIGELHVCATCCGERYIGRGPDQYKAILDLRRVMRKAGVFKP